MEAKINIAEILKDKPLLLKFYSTTYGRITFNGVHKGKVYFFSEDTNAHSVNQNGKMYDGGECIIFPSKEMRDWEKFSWKKGDVLVMDGWFDAPQRCIVKGCCNVSWFEGNEFNSSGWWIDYRYKPDHCKRTVQHTIREEELFDTEQEALIALFEKFKDKVKRKIEFFNKESKKLGIKQELRLLKKG